MRKKIGAFLLMAMAIAMVFISGCGDDNDSSQNNIYTASGHPDWPPIMYQNEDKIVGAGPDLVSLIFQKLGLNIEILYTGPWDIVQEKARAGEIDLIVAAYKTPERETYMDYTIPYTIDPVSLFVKKGKAFPFENWDELIDKKGVVTRGDSYGAEFDAFIEEKLEVVVVDTPAEAFNLIISGEADYFVYALYSGENTLKKNEELAQQIEIIPNYVSAENFYMTISKKSQLVFYLPMINEILQKLIDDGTVEELIEKHKNQPMAGNPNQQ